MRVLIADDDGTIRALLGDMLADLGHDVVTASTGAEAVDLAEELAPDVAILDYLMPRLSGLDALREIRHRGLHFPVILLTAISNTSIRELDGSDQADAIVEKPFKRNTIEKALEKALRSRS